MREQINRSAVLHIPMSQYAFAQAEDMFTVRLRCAKGDLDVCTLFFGDRACRQSPVAFEEREMEVKWQDVLYDYYETTLTACPQRICYYFRLQKGGENVLYYSDDFHEGLPDKKLEDGFVLEARSEYYQYPYILKSEVLSEPEWFQNAIVYNIFPDSFANGKRSLKENSFSVMDECGRSHKTMYGGTLQGILENLDYIQELGFNCLYLNPIFSAGEYHRYDILDYYHVDPCLGDENTMKTLVKEIHERGMRIVIDGVFNHCSWQFPPFADLVEKGEASAYRDWFYETKLPVSLPADGELPNYACFAYEKKMPKLNTANPEVQEYFAKVGRYWIEEYEVDGWRLDVANEVDRNFWRVFRQAVKSANPEAVMIGEVWENAETWLRGDAFDSVMNYDFRKHCRDFFANGAIDGATFVARMTDMQLRYPIQITRGQLNLLDSHDVARFLSLCREDSRLWKCAFLYLMMAPGVPSVFYGDEKEIAGYREPEYRSAMPWQEYHEEMERFIKEAIQIRKQYIAPADEWKIIEAPEKEPYLIFERIGRYQIRVLLSREKGVPERTAELMQGEVLLADSTGRYLVVKR